MSERAIERGPYKQAGAVFVFSGFWLPPPFCQPYPGFSFFVFKCPLFLGSRTLTQPPLSLLQARACATVAPAFFFFQPPSPLFFSFQTHLFPFLCKNKDTQKTFFTHVLAGQRGWGDRWITLVKNAPGKKSRRTLVSFFFLLDAHFPPRPPTSPSSSPLQCVCRHQASRYRGLCAGERAICHILRGDTPPSRQFALSLPARAPTRPKCRPPPPRKRCIHRLPTAGPQPPSRRPPRRRATRPKTARGRFRLA